MAKKYIMKIINSEVSCQIALHICYDLYADHNFATLRKKASQKICEAFLFGVKLSGL